MIQVTCIEGATVSVAVLRAFTEQDCVDYTSVFWEDVARGRAMRAVDPSDNNACDVTRDDLENGTTVITVFNEEGEATFFIASTSDVTTFG